MKQERSLAPLPVRPGQRDLFLVLGLSTLLLVLIALGELPDFVAPLRIALGLAFVLFIPGYCVTAALFAAAEDLDLAERMGLSIGLSVALVPLQALLLDALPWGIRLEPIAASELVLILPCCLLALWRRRRLGARAYSPRLAPHPAAWWQALPRSRRALALLVGGSLVVAAASASLVLLGPDADQFVTEFYILGGQGQAEDYPREVALSQPLTATLGIRNHERAGQTYRVEVWAIDGLQPNRRQLVAQQGPLTLAPGQADERPIAWAMPYAGPDQQVELLLFVEGQAEPYRRLRLWVAVT